MIANIKSRVIVGLMLILIGGLFILNNYNILDLPSEYMTWEFFFILFGLLLFILSNNKTAGTIFIGIGLFNLIPELWPLIFVAIGLYIILRRRNNSSTFQTRFNFHKSQEADAEISNKDFIEETAIFGGTSKIFHADNFRGGNIVSIFGGSEINLTNCKLAEGENVLNMTAIFGGTTIVVPRNWKIDLDVMPIFGGFGDERIKNPTIPIDESKTLVIKGLVLFGGGEIKG